MTWMSDKEVAAYIGRAVETVRWWRMEKKGPPYYKMAGRIRYRLDEVEAWLATIREVA